MRQRFVAVAVLTKQLYHVLPECAAESGEVFSATGIVLGKPGLLYLDPLGADWHFLRALRGLDGDSLDLATV